MAFVVFTDADEPFLFHGQIAGNKGNLLFKDAKGVRIYKTDRIVAIMRQDFAEEYRLAMEELRRLKHGDPTDN